METYSQKFREDIDAIDAELPDEMPLDIRLAERAGRFRALAAFYSGCADFHAAKDQARLADPASLARSVAGLNPTTAYLATFFYNLCEGVSFQDDITQEIISAIETAADACHEEASAIQRREEDLDAAAAAASDAAYDRKVDAGLIGRSDMAPEAA